MKVLITGGAGFLGSHLADRLLDRRDQVICVDNLSTGSLRNVRLLQDSSDFEFIQADITDGIPEVGPVDVVAHLASPASPPDYLALPLETMAVGSRGTENALSLAHRNDARFVLASTSEIYGDPLEHPQHESYLGNVSSIGPRSVYDEAKRYAEAVTMAHARSLGTNVGIMRIFNTYGPRMRANDGRVVSSFIVQALDGKPITIYGDGSQTRSFCYVDDLVNGIVALIDSRVTGPINLGNPSEYTVRQLAELVLEITGSTSSLEFHPLPTDDPTRRKPDISRASTLLKWAPETDVLTGLKRTIDWFSRRPDEVHIAAQELAGPQASPDDLTLDLGIRTAV
jgi:dTDP-glucose 4,6-dehydratase